MGATVDGPNITVSASASIDTTFMRVLVFETLDVSGETEVTRQIQQLDVVLAMDMSGSMAWDDDSGQPRIEGTRTAAKELVSLLYGDDASKELLNIGLVPWNGKVNVTINGSTYHPDLNTIDAVAAFTNPLTSAAQSEIHLAVNSPVPLLSEAPNDWQGCVFSRYIHNGATDDDADAPLGSLSGGFGDWVAWEPIGPEGEPVSGSELCELASSGQECRACLDHGITPLSHTRAAIDELTNTESPFYHYAPDGAALVQVFKEVANHVSELRLSK